jgi:hypothetical protein
MAKIDFTDLGLDIIGGTVFGGLAGIIEYTLSSAVSSLPLSSFITPTLVTPLALVVGALAFAGAVFTKIGSKSYAAASASTPN